MTSEEMRKAKTYYEDLWIDWGYYGNEAEHGDAVSKKICESKKMQILAFENAMQVIGYTLEFTCGKIVFTNKDSGEKTLYKFNG